MRFTLPAPRLLGEARQQSRGHAPIAEIFIFIIVFLVGNLLAGFLQIPAVVVLGQDTLAELFAAAASGDLANIDVYIDRFVTEISTNPMITLVSLFTFAALIACTFFYCTRLEKRRLATLGFRKRRAAREYLVGLAAGVGSFGAAALFCVLTGTLTFQGPSFDGALGLIALFLLGFLIQGLAEEVLCRGYFLVSLARRQSLPVAVLVSSLAFAAMHGLNQGITPLALLNLVLFGVFAAVYLLKRGDIWGIAAFHTAWNFAQGNVFGISVSGAARMPSLFSFAPSGSDALINGGAFGLEGGLAVTLVCTAGIVVLLLTRTREPDRTAVGGQWAA
ncbi:MAG: CPBP family intramembrane metalloprotease [Oscillospiraceae bacterium]|jgi:membrane protease YdiL (CAAX protease family)|nr:CPBP family intramembrane metalloprotease [Oscillospiraceae bacterium]